MKYITKEVRIGIAGIVALCVLVYGINWLKGIHMFQPSSYFYAKFQNVNGLTKSSPVFADGVRVGIVRDIEYDYVNPGNVIVEVELDTELRIPKGSSAELVSELMGGVRMNILLANNPREKYAIGDTIPGTLNNGMMEKVATMMPQVEKMLPKLDSILASLNVILADPAIPATLHNVQDLTASMAGTSRQSCCSQLSDERTHEQGHPPADRQAQYHWRQLCTHFQQLKGDRLCCRHAKGRRNFEQCKNDYRQIEPERQYRRTFAKRPFSI